MKSITNPETSPVDATLLKMKMNWRGDGALLAVIYIGPDTQPHPTEDTHVLDFELFEHGEREAKLATAHQWFETCKKTQPWVKRN